MAHKKKNNSKFMLFFKTIEKKHSCWGKIELKKKNSFEEHLVVIEKKKHM